MCIHTETNTLTHKINRCDERCFKFLKKSSGPKAMGVIDMVSPGKKGSPTLAAQVLPFKGGYCEEEQQKQQLHRASWAERRR